MVRLKLWHCLRVGRIYLSDLCVLVLCCLLSSYLQSVYVNFTYFEIKRRNKLQTAKTQCQQKANFFFAFV